MAAQAVGCCSFANYSPPVIWFADSIPYGIGCSTLAGPREPAYFLGQASNPFIFVGTQSNAGGGGGLTVDPFCECYPGISTTGLNTDLGNIALFNPRIVIYSAGINDVIAGDPAATIAGHISTGLDTARGYIIWQNYRIIVTALMKTLDPTNDAVVQATNALLPAVCASKPNCVFVPQWYNAIPGPTVGVNMHDNVHPNDVGVPYLASALWNNGLQAAVQVCRGAT